MAFAATARPSRDRRAEQATYDRLLERLRVVFPEVPDEEILRTVAGQYEKHENNPVQHFVPSLVTRRARPELAGLPTPRYRA